MPHDPKKYRRVTVDFLHADHDELEKHLEKIGKKKLGKNEFICNAVKFAILANLQDVVPAPRPAPFVR